MKLRKTNKVGKFEVKKVKNKEAVSKNVVRVAILSTLPLNVCVRRTLKVHCHAIQWFFVDFLRQKNGADPTQAAPDQTNRGAGLVKIRGSQSRDSACGNGSESRRPAIRPSLQRRAQDWAAVRVSHHLVLPRYRAFFSSFCIALPGRHTNNRTLAQCRCECPVPGFLFADLLSSNPVPEVSPEQGSETGEAWLAGAHNNTCQSTRKVLSSKLSPAYIYCERERDRQKGRSMHTRLLQQQLAKPDLCQRASRRSRAEHRTTAYRRVCILSIYAKTDRVKHGRHYFSPQQNGAKNHWIAWQCTFNIAVGGRGVEAILNEFTLPAKRELMMWPLTCTSSPSLSLLSIDEFLILVTMETSAIGWPPSMFTFW